MRLKSIEKEWTHMLSEKLAIRIYLKQSIKFCTLNDFLLVNCKKKKKQNKNYYKNFFNFINNNNN